MSSNNPDARLLSRHKSTGCQSSGDYPTRERLCAPRSGNRAVRPSLFQQFHREESRNIERVQLSTPSRSIRSSSRSNRSFGSPSSQAEQSIENSKRSTLSTNSDGKQTGNVEHPRDSRKTQEAPLDADAWAEDEYFLSNLGAATDALSKMFPQMRDNCAMVVRMQERLKNVSSHHREAFENVTVKFAQLSHDHRLATQKMQNLKSQTMELKGWLETEKDSNRQLTEKYEGQKRKNLQAQLAHGREIEMKKREIQKLHEELNGATSKLREIVDLHNSVNEEKTELFEKLQEAEETTELTEKRLEKCQQEWEASVTKERLNVNELRTQLKHEQKELEKAEETSVSYQKQIEQLSIDAKRFEEKKTVLERDKVSLENKLKTSQKMLDDLSEKKSADQDIFNKFLNEVQHTICVISKAYVDSEVTKVSGEQGILETEAQKISLLNEPMSAVAHESLNQTIMLTKIPTTHEKARSALLHLNVWGKEAVQRGSRQTINQRVFLRKIEAMLENNISRAVVAHDQNQETGRKEMCDQSENPSSIELSSINNMFDDLFKKCSESEFTWTEKLKEVERKKTQAEEKLKACQESLQCTRKNLKQNKSVIEAELKKNRDQTSKEIDRINLEKNNIEQQLQDSQNETSCLRKEHEEFIQQSEKKIKKMQSEHNREIKANQRAYEKEIKKLNTALETERENREKDVERLKSLNEASGEAEKDHITKTKSLEKEVCRLRDLMAEEIKKRERADGQLETCEEKLKETSLQLGSVSEEAKNAKEAVKGLKSAETAMNVNLEMMRNQLEETKACLAHSKKEVEVITQYSFEEKKKAEQRVIELEATLKKERSLDRERREKRDIHRGPFGTPSQQMNYSEQGVLREHGAQANSVRKRERPVSDTNTKKRRSFLNTPPEVYPDGDNWRKNPNKGGQRPANENNPLMEEYYDLENE